MGKIRKFAVLFMVIGAMILFLYGWLLVMLGLSKEEKEKRKKKIKASISPFWF
jgi:hypothetical protein